MDYRENLGADIQSDTTIPQAIKGGGIDAVQTMTKYSIIAACAIGAAYVIFDKKQRNQIKNKFLYGK